MANRNASGMPDTFDTDLMAWLEAGRPSGEFAAAEFARALGMLASGDEEERACARALLARLADDFAYAPAKQRLREG